MTTLTLAPQLADASIRLTLTADRIVRSITRTDENGTAAVRVLPGVLPYVPPVTETRRNLHPNPRFLNGGSIPGGSYQLFSNNGTFATALSVFTSAAPAGFLNNEKNGVVWDVTIPATTAALAVAMAYTRTGPADAVLVLEALNAAGAVVGTGTARNTAGGILTATTGTPTGTVVRFKLSAYIENKTGATTTAASSVAFTRPVVESGSAAGAYFDGGTLGPDTAAHYFTGTPHNSASVEGTYAGSLTLTDYEPAAGRVSYVANGETTKSAAYITDFALPGPWLYCPVMPSFSVPLKTVTGYGAKVDSHSTIVNGSGRRSPIVILREMGTRSGSMDLYAGTYREALDIRDACDRGELLMFRQPEHPGMDMYFTAVSASIATLHIDGAGTVFGVSVDYLEVDRPGGGLAGAIGWTFASVAAAAPTFADLTDMFDTFEDLRLNQRITP